MKQVLLMFIAWLAVQPDGFTQNNIQLNIHHKLGDADFLLNTGAKNNIGHDFELTRLEYYVSGISIVHDNGIVTAIHDLWILVNAAGPTQVDLGNYPINEVEGIHFYIGVDPEHNHLDPASYDPSHPLAPKAPSMHWGWAAGYRFMALEGYGGSNYDQLIQLHGLGDQNYIKTKLLVSATAVNNEVIINLDADYARALEDINVNSGIIVHGETMEARQALENFRYLVFSPSGEPTATLDLNTIKRFDVFPNPAAAGITNVLFEATDDQAYTILLTDACGKEIKYFQPAYSNTITELSIGQPGLYIISLIKEGQQVISRKLISN